MGSWQTSVVKSDTLLFCLKSDAPARRFTVPGHSNAVFVAGWNLRLRRMRSAVRIPEDMKTGSPRCGKPVFGAAGQIRTADLVITNDALYRLSYSSMAVSNSFIIIA